VATVTAAWAGPNCVVRIPATRPISNAVGTFLRNEERGGKCVL